MMNTIAKFVRSAKFVALMIAFLASVIFVFPTQVMAAGTNASLINTINETINIIGGEFNVNVEGDIPSAITIRSAQVSLPEGVTGTINMIVITGPDGAREFGCPQNKVQNGTDLIKVCGGPAALKAGDTRYMAQGSNFAPGDNIPFSVTLSPDFQ